MRSLIQRNLQESSHSEPLGEESMCCELIVSFHWILRYTQDDITTIREFINILIH